MLAMSRAPKKETVKQPEVELIDYVLVRDPLEPEKVGIVKVRALVALDAAPLLQVVRPAHRTTIALDFRPPPDEGTVRQARLRRLLI